MYICPFVCPCVSVSMRPCVSLCVRVSVCGCPCVYVSVCGGTISRQTSTYRSCPICWFSLLEGIRSSDSPAGGHFKSRGSPSTTSTSVCLCQPLVGPGSPSSGIADYGTVKTQPSSLEQVPRPLLQPSQDHPDPAETQHSLHGVKRCVEGGAQAEPPRCGVMRTG